MEYYSAIKGKLLIHATKMDLKINMLKKRTQIKKAYSLHLHKI